MARFAHKDSEYKHASTGSIVPVTVVFQGNPELYLLYDTL